jgi:hypothetical protein
MSKRFIPLKKQISNLYDQQERNNNNNNIDQHQEQERNNNNNIQEPFVFHLPPYQTYQERMNNIIENNYEEETEEEEEDSEDDEEVSKDDEEVSEDDKEISEDDVNDKTFIDYNFLKKNNIKPLKKKKEKKVYIKKIKKEKEKEKQKVPIKKLPFKYNPKKEIETKPFVFPTFDNYSTSNFNPSSFRKEIIIDEYLEKEKEIFPSYKYTPLSAHDKFRSINDSINFPIFDINEEPLHENITPEKEKENFNSDFLFHENTIPEKEEEENFNSNFHFDKKNEKKKKKSKKKRNILCRNQECVNLIDLSKKSAYCCVKCKYRENAVSSKNLKKNWDKIRKKKNLEKWLEDGYEYEDFFKIDD